MGSRFSKNSNVSSERVRKLAQPSSGDGDVMIFKGGFKQLIDRKIIWEIENLAVGGDSHEHRLKANIAGASWSACLFSEPVNSGGDAMVTCSCKFEGGWDSCRFSVKAAIHGRRGKLKRFQSSVKKFGEDTEIFCMEMGALLPFLSGAGSLTIELIVTVYQEKSVIGDTKNLASVPGSGESVKQPNDDSKIKLENSKDTKWKDVDSTRLDETMRCIENRLKRLDLMTDPQGKAKPAKESEVTRSRAASSKPVSAPIATAASRHPCEITPQAFEEIVRERAVTAKRKAEEKRLEGFRRIMEINYNIGNSRLELLPKEVWIKILDKLKPEDRMNMCLVHHRFSDMMRDSMIQDVLFPLVMEYRIPLVQRHLISPSSEIFPEKKDLKQLVILRLVSKSMRDSVDKWIDDRLEHFMQTVTPKYRILPSGFHHSFRQILNTVDFSKIQDQVIGYSRWQRFFLRSLRVKIPAGKRNMGEIYDWNRSVSEFLRIFGQQILHLDLHFCIDFDNTPTELEALGEVYSAVWEWLMLVPNLKWLMVEGAGGEFSKFPAGHLIEPMPNMCELKRFDLCGSGLFDVGDAILDTNRHIKCHPREPELCDSIRDDVPVSRLALETAHFGWGQALVTCACNSLPVLLPDAYSNWKLKRVELWLHSRSPACTSMADIFRFIEKFQTLEIVQLYIDDVSMGDGINFLRLPNLTDFSIVFGPTIKSGGDRFFHSLQFLLHCSKLRTLFWENRMDPSTLHSLFRVLRMTSGAPQFYWDDHDHGIRLDFYGGKVNLSASNIWKVFPELRSVTVKFPYATVVDKVAQKCFK